MSVDFANYSDLDGTQQFNELCDLYSRTTHRVRRALFPEILIEDDISEEELHYTSHQPQQQHQPGQQVYAGSVVGLFAEPSQQLKAAVLDLLSFRDQLNDAINNIPQLIRSLCDQDPEVVGRAAQMVYLLSKEDGCVATLASHKQLIDALINAARTTNNEKTKSQAAAALSHISNHPEGCMHIFHSGGIAELVRMLQSPVQLVVHYAVTTLHNLLLYVEIAKEEIIACGGLESFVPHLRSHNPKLQALVADCLYFLLLDRPQCKLNFLSAQGPRYLVSILRSQPTYDKLTYAAVRCMRSISTCLSSKQSLISMGGLEVLHQVLGGMRDGKRKLAVLNSMRNLSDLATNLDTLAPLVVDLVLLVEAEEDEELVSCACGILSNLTCNNNRNKEAVCTNQGLSILARALERFHSIEDVTEPALCTLRHCTVRHPMAQQAQNELRFAHSIILTLLSTRRPPIVKAALGVMRNCALSHANLQSIIKEKTPEGDTVVSIAVETLDQSGMQLQQDFDGLSEGVSLLELVEGTLSALHQLAKDPMVAQFIYNQPPVMGILVELMALPQISNNEDELMMREIMGLIYQLTKTAEGAKIVQLYGPQAHISEALNSVHKSVAAYASIILKNLGLSTPTDYVDQQQHYGGIAPSDTLGSSAHPRHPISGEMGWLNDGMEPELYNELCNYPPSLEHLKQHDHIEGGAQGRSWFDTDL